MNPEQQMNREQPGLRQLWGEIGWCWALELGRPAPGAQSRSTVASAEEWRRGSQPHLGLGPMFQRQEAFSAGHSCPLQVLF